MVRFDAIAYLWKEVGTSCIHLSQTHDMVKLFRSLFDMVAPDVIIITETNVPHNENISYFGNGMDEAQMVYNFTLPPLLLYTFIKEDSTIFSRWAKGLDLPSDHTTFFNFTASHDGIGVRPLEGIITPDEIDEIIERVKQNGGRVSYKENPDGSKSPYELNITYVDALKNGPGSDESASIKKFLASQAIQAVLPGVPGIYIHSLLGSKNWEDGVKQTERARTINREKLVLENIEKDLDDTNSFRAGIFHPYIRLIKTRIKQTAFHPNAGFRILNIDPRIFAIARFNKKQTIYALTNISSHNVKMELAGEDIPKEMTDLLTMRQFNTGSLYLEPYEYIWLSDFVAE